MNKTSLTLRCIAFAVFCLCHVSIAFAGPKRVCHKTDTGAVVTKRKCKAEKNEVELNFAALMGNAGAEGADGQLRIYGDGSAGAKTVSADETLGADAPPEDDSNLQYTDVTIDAGVTLTIPSGVTIRCTGTFTNNGTVVVQTGVPGGTILQDSTSTFPRLRMAHPGVSSRAASHPEFGDVTANRSAGLGGIGLTEIVARNMLHPGSFGGGSGSPDGSGAGNNGGDAGGSLVVLCQGEIINNGTISADAPDTTTGGGGGGGVVILASQTGVTNSATGAISVNGGKGEDADNNQGPAGGGGGGILHLLGSAVNNLGALTADGGSQGTNGAAGSVTGDPRSGGGAGGASGGDGGNGGGVSAANTPAIAQDGDPGHILTTVVEPTALF